MEVEQEEEEDVFPCAVRHFARERKKKEERRERSMMSDQPRR